MHSKNKLSIFLAALVVLAPLAAPIALAKVAPIANIDEAVTTAESALDSVTIPAAVPDVPDLADCATVCSESSGHEGTTVQIVAPVDDAGSKSADTVRITWTVPVIDPFNLFYRVETRSDAEGAEWTTDGIESDGCKTAPGSVGGTCSAIWTPAGPGTYAIRVVHIGQLANDSVCELGVNCAVVYPYYVDDAPPTLTGVAVAAADLGSDGKIDTLAPTFSAVGEDDDNAVDRVEIVVSSGNFIPESCTYLPASEVGCTILIQKFVTKVYENPDVYQGSIDVTATVYDKVGNSASASQPFDVDTAGNEVVQVQPLSTIPTLVRNDESVALTYKVVSVLPASKNGEAKAGAAFELRDAAANLVCSKIVPANGIVACPVAHTDARKTYTARLVENVDYDSVSYTSSIIWTALNVERLQDLDTPQTSLHVNAGDTYSAAFRVTTTWDDNPVSGAFVKLAESSELTDVTGLVRVPLVREVTTVETVSGDATYQTLKNAGPSVDLVWTTVDLDSVVLDDAFVNVGDVIGFTGTSAVYNHGANEVVESALLTLAVDGPEGCSVTGTITDGVVAGTAVCNVVFDGDLPLKIVSSTLGITKFTSDVLLPGIWTNIEVTNPVFDNFVNINDEVTVTAAVNFAHSAKPAVATATLGLIEPVADCELRSATVVAGQLTAVLACSEVSSGTGTDFAFEVLSAENDVLQLAEAFELNAVWTNVVLSIDAYDDFVNVEDTVSLVGTAVWEHDGSYVAAGTFAFAEAQSDCELLTGTITDGAVAVDVACTMLSAASGTQIDLLVASATEDVTDLSAAFVLDAVWTKILVGTPDFDAFVNVSSTVTFTATAMYEHDGSNVVDAAVMFTDPVDNCAMLEGSAIANGVLTVSVSCDAVSIAEGTALPVIVTSGDQDVVNLTTPLVLTATWTQIVITPPVITDDFVNRNDTVHMTATATWAHNGLAVDAGTFAFGSTVDGCTLETGSIVAGDVTVDISCIENSGADGTTIPLVVVSATDDVLQLAADLSVTAVWTQVIVSYVTDANTYTQAPNAVVKFTATVTYAHNGATVHKAVVSVTDGERTFRCLTQTDGSCFARVSRDLGSSDFTVSAYATGPSVFDEDINSMTEVQEGVSHRWTAIGFGDYSCAVLVGDVAGEEVPCDTQFAQGSTVRVWAKAVEADTGVNLVGAAIEFDGYDRTTDDGGRAFIDVPGFGPGPVTLNARGVSATIAEEIVTATIASSVTLTFA